MQRRFMTNHRERLAAASAQIQVMAKHLPIDLVTGVFFYVPTDEARLDYHGRMFAPLHGIAEDPATGSANVALVGLLADIDSAEDLVLQKTIAQGVDMGRPSILLAEAEKRAGVVSVTRIAGHCVAVMEGHLTVS